MTDHYTHLRLSAPDPVADLRSRMAEAGVREAIVVETWDGGNRGQLDRIRADGLWAVYCLREGMDVSQLGNASVAGLRVRTAQFGDPGAWTDALRRSGKVLYVHAESGIGALARRVCELAAREPAIPVFIPHMAWPRREGSDDPDWESAIRELGALTQVSIGISAMAHFSGEAFPHRDAERFARRIVETFKPHGVAPSSDYPFSCGDDYAGYMNLARVWTQTKCPTR